MADYDLAIIGAGMAGASLAAEVGPHARVLLLEAEEFPGYHTTGRSAAFWEECYGGPEIVPLSRASESYLRDGGFLSPRGALYIGRNGDAAKMDAFEARFANTGARFERLAPGAVHARVPSLREEWREAIWQPHCADIDVAGLHQHYLKVAKAAGVQLVTHARIEAIERERAQAERAEDERAQAKRAASRDRSRRSAGRQRHGRGAPGRSRPRGALRSRG